MTFTVDTHKKLITITSSLKYEELVALRESFPSEFINDYKWLIPFDLIEQVTIGELAHQPKQIEQREYPLQQYDGPRDCGCGGDCVCEPRNEDC